MAIAFLTPSWISTIGDDKAELVCGGQRGFLQGSPLSPSLYNLFMDEFAERVSEVPTEVADVPGQYSLPMMSY